jgi:hypothetical protein
MNSRTRSLCREKLEPSKEPPKELPAEFATSWILAKVGMITEVRGGLQAERVREVQPDGGYNSTLLTVRLA